MIVVTSAPLVGAPFLLQNLHGLIIDTIRSTRRIYVLSAVIGAMNGEWCDPISGTPLITCRSFQTEAAARAWVQQDTR